MSDDFTDSFSEFDSQLSSVRKKLEPLLTLSPAVLNETLSPLDRAKVHVALAYAINSLFYSTV